MARKPAALAIVSTQKPLPRTRKNRLNRYNWFCSGFCSEIARALNLSPLPPGDCFIVPWLTRFIESRLENKVLGVLTKFGDNLRSMPKNSYSMDLIKQMAVCDANYIRLLKLVPQLGAYLDSSFSNHIKSAGTRPFELTANEPEKALEGIKTQFCIADQVDENAEVTVEIKILEAFKYTTTLEIIQKPELKQWMTNPSMLVRVYHDANTAEVVSYQSHRNLKPRYSSPNPKMYHADEKVQVNEFLGEWLTHCLNVGRSIKVPKLTCYS